MAVRFLMGQWHSMSTVEGWRFVLVGIISGQRLSVVQIPGPGNNSSDMYSVA